MTFAKNSVDIPPFPGGVDCRVVISGLAYCDLDKPHGTSCIHFLSHVPYHALTMEITQRWKLDPQVVISTWGPIPIPAGSSLTIRNSAPHPSATPARNLVGMVDLPDLHNHLIEENSGFPSALSKPTTVFLHDFSFATLVQSKDYFYFECNDSSSPAPTNPQRIGAILGANLTGNRNSSTKITSGVGYDTIALLNHGLINEFVYQVTFFNHCSGDDVCGNLMGDDSDFRFYYDLLREKNHPGRRFKLRLKSGTSGQGLGVAACNPIITYPGGPH